MRLEKKESRVLMKSSDGLQEFKRLILKSAIMREYLFWRCMFSIILLI